MKRALSFLSYIVNGPEDYAEAIARIQAEHELAVAQLRLERQDTIETFSFEQAVQSAEHQLELSRLTVRVATAFHESAIKAGYTIENLAALQMLIGQTDQQIRIIKTTGDVEMRKPLANVVADLERAREMVEIDMTKLKKEHGENLSYLQKGKAIQDELDGRLGRKNGPKRKDHERAAAASDSGTIPEEDS